MMAPYDSDDEVEDIGRLQSEAQMQNKAKEAYLADIKEQALLDYNDTMELIEREKKTLQTDDQNFLKRLDVALHDGALEKSEHDGVPNNSHRISTINTLLEACDTLLQLNRTASKAVHTARISANEDWTSLQQALAADQKHAKKVLAAGKRIVEREIDGFDADGEKVNDGNDNVDGEVLAQASGIFHGRVKEALSSAGVDYSLERMEKGVRKMVKGLDPT